MKRFLLLSRASAFRFLFFTTLILTVSPQLSIAQRVSPSDFDADGLSDFVLINSNDNVLSWSAIKADGSAQHALGEFGRLGHQIALGDYLGTNVPQPATVSESKGKIIWRIFSNGVSTAKTFGAVGETALAGGDFNADGKLDAVTVVAQGKKLNWSIHPSLFTDSNATPLAITFGKPKDLYFFSNPDGKGDRLTTLSNQGRRGFTLRYYTVAKNSISRKTVPLVVGSGKLKNRPLPLKLESGKDALVFFQKRPNSILFSIYRPGKNKLQSFRLKVAGDILIGNFNGEAGEEIAVQSSTGFTVYNPTTKHSFPVSSPAGIAVDEVNINRIGTTRTTPVDDDDDNSPPPTSGEPPLAGLKAVCEKYSTIAMGEMLIKSEISNHIPGMDPRATGYTLVCGRNCTKNLSRSDFFYADGSYAGSVAYYGRFSGNGQPRLYGAVGQAPQHFADQIAAKARTIGNGKLYMQMSVARSGPSTDCKEFNPVGRNGDV